jgi:hypothetical protein
MNHYYIPLSAGPLKLSELLRGEDKSTVSIPESTDGERACLPQVISRALLNKIHIAYTRNESKNKFLYKM